MVDALTETLLRLLPEVGPVLLFALAVLETCFITGLVIPAGVALLLASALVAAGTLSLVPVLLYALGGALVGDSVGFWVGRFSGRALDASRRRIGGLSAGQRRRVDRILSSHPLVSVSFARAVAFVRTLMPMAAGASRLSYPRFLVYDLIGVGAWAALYVGIGWIAGESWHRAGNVLGLVVGTLFVLGTWRLWARRRAAARPGLLSVALTGNVAAGKSTVADVWRAQGVPMVSADELARRASAPGSEGLAAIREAFGPEALSADGSLDREWMRARVFGNDAERARLEAILHPRIRALRDAWMDAQRRARARLVVAEVPLLFETGMEDDFDRVVLVDATDEVRRARLLEGRGLDPEVADKLMASQMDPELKRARSDYVIENDGDLAQLRSRAREVLGQLRGEAG